MTPSQATFQRYLRSPSSGWYTEAEFTGKYDNLADYMASHPRTPHFIHH
jgi:hypothetical protein